MKVYKFIIESKHGNFEVLIDMKDKEIALSRKWSISKTGNYIRVEARINKKLVRLHRYILGITDKNIEVDHKNRNTLDNRRSNLRIADRNQNMRNVKFTRKNKHGYVGVYKWKNYYRGCLSINNKTVHVSGYFDTAEEAAKARDELAYKTSGEFAILNFPINKKVG